jgi:hypothetical protein
MTVRGRNFRNIQTVRIEPSADITVSGPYVLDDDGVELQFVVTVGEAAASGERSVIIATPAGESPVAVNAGNLIRIARQTGSTYAGISSPLVGVLAGADNTGSQDGAMTETTFASLPIGVLVSGTAPETEARTSASAPVGIVAGSAALDMQPTGWLQGASGTITVSGHGLDAVTAVSAHPATGVLLGTPVVNDGGTSLTVSIAVAPDAAEGVQRQLRLQRLDGQEVAFSSASKGQFGIGALPVLDSITPVILNPGNGYTLTIRGRGMRSVIGIEALGAPGLRFSNDDIAWSSDGGNELITVPLYIEPSAAPGSRVLRLIVPGGASAAEQSSSNAVTVVPQQ